MEKELSIKLHLYPQLKDEVEGLSQEEIDNISHTIIEALSKIDLSDKIKELKSCEMQYQIHVKPLRMTRIKF